MHAFHMSVEPSSTTTISAAGRLGENGIQGFREQMGCIICRDDDRDLVHTKCSLSRHPENGDAQNLYLARTG